MEKVSLTYAASNVTLPIKQRRDPEYVNP
jgi:hypothetical protein